MSLLDKASLVQIPSGYKATKLYSVVPDSGAGDFTFARSSTGSRVGSDGLIETGVAIDTPRLDYSGGASCASLLLEPQSTNLVTQSETFSNWDTEGGKQVVTQGVLISPDGTLNGNKLETYNSTTVSARKLWKANNVIVGASYTFSVYIKQVSGQINSGFLHITTGANDTFDVSQAYTATDQWQRVSVTTNSAASSQIRFLITGDANSQIYIWGAQVEQQSYATSYIPTSGSTTTRTADRIPSQPLSTALTTEGTIYIDFDKIIKSNLGFGFTNSSNQTSYMFYFYSDGMDIYNNAAFIVNRSTLEPNNSKVAVSWNGTNVKVYINGNDRTKSGAVASLNNTEKISFDSGANICNMNAIYLFTEQLSDTELAALTTI